MSLTGIPPGLEPAIAARIELRHSPREIAQWLRQAHGLRVTVMAVHQTVERLRSKMAPTPDLEQELEELRSQLPRHRQQLEAMARRFPELSTPGMTKTIERLRRLDARFVFARRLLTQRSRMLQRWSAAHR